MKPSKTLLHTSVPFLLGALLTLALFSTLIPIASAYNRDGAKQYANKWTEDNPSSILHNEDYPYYPKNDCANYVSQCLIEGGFDLSAGPGVIKRTIPNCDDLHTNLVRYQHAKHIRIETSESLPENIGVGDVIIFGSKSDEWKHAAIVVDGSGNNVKLNAHTNHRANQPLSFFAKGYTIAHIYHFPTAYETGYTQEYFGTGRWRGEGALDLVVYRPRQNYEGYIVTNDDSTDQDMVIGEDTSSFSGCSHPIKAYCCDASKGVPNRGETFGQPWTCDSPQHWAYWVKEVVKYSNQNNCSTVETSRAIWYITDRRGLGSSYNDVLSSIGYPNDGPDKNAGVSYSIKGHVFDSSSKPLGSVSVNLAGDISWTRTTNATGYFEFVYLPKGNYTVTINNATLTSDPSIRAYNSLDANQENQDFTVRVTSNGITFWVWLIVGAGIIISVVAVLWYLLARRRS